MSEELRELLRRLAQLESPELWGTGTCVEFADIQEGIEEQLWLAEEESK